MKEAATGADPVLGRATISFREAGLAGGWPRRAALPLQSSARLLAPRPPTHSSSCFAFCPRCIAAEIRAQGNLPPLRRCAVASASQPLRLRVCRVGATMHVSNSGRAVGKLPWRGWRHSLWLIIAGARGPRDGNADRRAIVFAAAALHASHRGVPVPWAVSASRAQEQRTKHYCRRTVLPRSSLRQGAVSTVAASAMFWTLFIADTVGDLCFLLRSCRSRVLKDDGSC